MIRKVRESRALPAVKLALEFLVLTAAKWGEVRWAEWAEIDRKLIDDWARYLDQGMREDRKPRE